MPHSPGQTFRALHVPGQPFVLANAWDRGSARLLESLGAQAIATSSAAHAFTLGRPDMGHVTRDEALAHAQDLVSAVAVPVQGDFEHGFGDSPETCAETVRLAHEVGLAGICIEDTALPSDRPYERDLAIERIRAAAAAARALPGDFVLTARADGLMLGSYGLDEALARLRGYEAAGADCLYAPLPATRADLETILAAVSVPVNVLAVGPYAAVPMADYAQMGVARLSLGSGLARVTHGAILSAAQQIFAGDFNGLNAAASGDEIDRLIARE